jgi:hypothetical protein
MCSHQISSPRPGHEEQPHVVAAHPEQGWNLLCDGTVVFDDGGELLPDGRATAPCRVLPADRLTVAA